MKLVLLILTVLMVGCGDNPQRTSQGVDPELQPFVNELNSLSLAYTGKALPLQNVAINFRKLGLHRRGECHYATSEIFINPQYWDAMAHQHNERLAILLHEIGHCAFLRGHDSESHDPSGPAPSTIMSEGAVSEYHFKINQKEYFIDLLGN